MIEEKNIYALGEQELTRVSAYSKLMRSVYLWMTFALIITGLTAATVAFSPAMLSMLFSSKITFYGLIIAELAVVIILSARIQKLSFTTATLMFILYSILTGATLSVIFLAYQLDSIVTTFFVTAGTFGSMTLIGYTTKKDLSKMGTYLLMTLIGLFIATLVNMFLANSTLDWIITYVGVLLFIGLTAYDTQKIKQMLREYGTEINENSQKMALMGSLTLYLDFINLFLYLLKILGNRK